MKKVQKRKTTPESKTAIEWIWNSNLFFLVINSVISKTLHL